MAVVNATSTPAAVATPPVIPKTGMSVQELKQLTALRVASQNAPVHANEVTGLVSKAVLNNAAKSHYRDNLRNSLTPGSTPKRSHHTRSNSSTQFSTSQFGFGNQQHHNSDLSRSHGPLSSGSSADVISVRGHRSRSRSSQLPTVDTSVDQMPARYSYSGGQSPEDYFSSYDFGGGGGNSTSSQETDPGRPSLEDATTSIRNSLLQFPGDSFPPPPPMDERATNAARRGSFGNAAEFFKFRRRSKSRLELARDLSFGDNGELGGYPSYGTAGAMPGIAERHGDGEGIHDESASDASSSTSGNDGSSSQDYTDEDVVQVTGGYDDTAEISGSFVSFYNAARQQQGGLSSLSIPPPPPPPPMTDDEDDASTTSSTKGNGLPMMSPNGARLRKVAEMARRGSMSTEDKTRAKDEIIQNSLGIGASNAARLLSTKMEDRGDRVPATAPMVMAPPGFSVPPRTTPKASKKMLASGTGIVRSSSATPSSTSAGAAAAAAALGANTVSSASSSGILHKAEAAAPSSNTLEERLAAAAQRVADCVGKGDMAGFQQAMDELDWLRNEASKIMRG
ncbi:hypothetical protein BBJ29_006837 [Phytophthora kernoviae]|uniref:Uncharacterized protein n=1 Tax=Phytophthora kernoviae TaxID=325452 RepID=A0A3F2S1G5_9STRA|nr:hypothetical protein BBJ29_006837 [Phytophthora kernoviae]RLN67908.1 hypothetical protein BBP00_00001352 [Phytophthora kernoviae]